MGKRLDKNERAIQKHWQHLAHTTQDKDKINKESTTQKTKKMKILNKLYVKSVKHKNKIT